MTMTENPASVVDSDEFIVRRTISIAAPIDKVWAAITEADHIKKWFGQIAVLDEVAPGAKGMFGFDGYGSFPILVEEVDAPRMIAYRWSNDNATALDPTLVDSNHSTVFRFTLEPTDGGTQLTVVESGFNTLSDPAASMESNRGGWDAELDELVAYLENGA
jgi:uncharacterized protein YndB with AHSA1/START domain